VEMQVFMTTLVLFSKERVKCCTFRVILTLHEYLHFYYKLYHKTQISPVALKRGAAAP